ncbi:hypothetical protein F1C58_06070 [Glaciihabitans sp. INWT7]|uniref:hypothetical protein n=1 Tax=Glaciihabitans sp. INWT7 TaxID=2596912 RepID=UPI001629840F|nr:hypothetical protein [Glaciihabitans sp. INWT7]QNE46516.1 hypothetical protein F1C58_06070 [Glaciihabitans sp. INWT7]
MSSVAELADVPPLNRSAVGSVVVGVGSWAVNTLIGGVLLIEFLTAPVSAGLSGLGPVIAVGLGYRVASLLLTVVALIVGFVLARRGLRRTRFARERGRVLAIVGLVVAWINVAVFVFGLLDTLALLAGSGH